MLAGVRQHDCLACRGKLEERGGVVANRVAVFFGVQFDPNALRLLQHLVGLRVCLRSTRIDDDILLEAWCLGDDLRRLFVPHNCVGFEPGQQSQEWRDDRQADVHGNGPPDDFGGVPGHHLVAERSLVFLVVHPVMAVNIDRGDRSNGIHGTSLSIAIPHAVGNEV